MLSTDFIFQVQRFVSEWGWYISFEYLNKQWSKWSHSSKTIKRLPTVNNVLWWIIYLIGYCQQHNVNKTIHKDCTCFCLPHMTQQETFKILFIYQIAMFLPVERIFIPFLLHQYLSSLFTCLLTQFQLLKTFNKSLI